MLFKFQETQNQKALLAPAVTGPIFGRATNENPIVEELPNN